MMDDWERGSILSSQNIPKLAEFKTRNQELRTPLFLSKCS